jgi:virginiamycin A acetyltransferase
MRFATDISKGPIHIGDDVWIGANCTITDGVKIGNGSVIGANSVVTSDVPEYSIYAGTPAKFIRKR